MASSVEKRTAREFIDELALNVDVASVENLAMREPGLDIPRKRSKAEFVSVAAEVLKFGPAMKYKEFPLLPRTSPPSNAVLIPAIDLSNVLHSKPHWAYSFSIGTHLLTCARLPIDTRALLPEVYCQDRLKLNIDDPLYVPVQKTQIQGRRDVSRVGVSLV